MRPPLIETREVLADAHHRANMRYLTHAVEVSAYDGHELRVLCTRVQLDALADRHAGDPTLPPTCTICQRELRRRGETS